MSDDNKVMCWLGENLPPILFLPIAILVVAFWELFVPSRWKE